MSYAETLESYMLRMELPHERVSEDTWVLAPDSLRHARIVACIEDPIVLYSTPLFAVSELTPDREGLFRKLLEFNDHLLYCAYALDNEQIVLSGVVAAWFPVVAAWSARASNRGSQGYQRGWVPVAE